MDIWYSGSRAMHKLIIIFAEVRLFEGGYKAKECGF